MFGYIYKTTNLITSKIYVGKKESFIFQNNYFGSGKILKLSIKKYGKNNFKVELICWCNTKKLLEKKEIHWISYYRTLLGIENLYNITKGGTGGDMLTNHPDREKIIKKITTAPRTKKWNKNISKGKKGKSKTLEHKEKIKHIISNLEKKECQYCNNLFAPAALAQYHGRNCKHNPNITLKQLNKRKRKRSKSAIKKTIKAIKIKRRLGLIRKAKRYQCIHCLEFHTNCNLQQFHGDFCLQNKNFTIEQQIAKRKHKNKYYEKTKFQRSF